MKALDDLFVMARIAEMERECQDGQEPDGSGFPRSPLGQRIIRLRRDIRGIHNATAQLERAVSYDPRHPPKE